MASNHCLTFTVETLTQMIMDDSFSTVAMVQYIRNLKMAVSYGIFLRQYCIQTIKIKKGLCFGGRAVRHQEF